MTIRPTSAAAPSDEAGRQRAWGGSGGLRLLAVGFALYYGLQLAWAASEFLLLGFLGVLLGLGLASAVDRLHALRVPRGVGAAVVVLAFHGALVGVGLWVAPTLRDQASELRRQLPEAIERADAWLEARSDGVLGTVLDGPGDHGASSPAAPPPVQDSSAAGARRNGAAPDASDGATPVRDRVTAGLRGSTQFIRPVLSGTASALAAILLVSFVAVYLAAEPSVYRRGLLHLVPHRARNRASEVLGATATALRRWLVTQFIAMVTVGAISTTVLLALDVQAAFALGVLAGLLEFVPIAGPIIAAIPAIGMAFITSPQTALYVAIAYVGIQQLESNVLTPLLMKQGLEIPPLLTIAAQGIMALLFGFAGLLVAVPLLTAILVPVRLLYVRDTIGDEVDEDGSRPCQRAAT